MSSGSWVSAGAGAWLSLALAGCGETYCQVGNKHGPTCYPRNDVEWQETQVVSDAPRGSSSEPAPGCVSVGSNGFVQQPFPRAGVPPPLPRLRGAYVVSGACVTQRQPVHGAVR